MILTTRTRGLQCLVLLCKRQNIQITQISFFENRYISILNLQISQVKFSKIYIQLHLELRRQLPPQSQQYNH